MDGEDISHGADGEDFSHTLAGFIGQALSMFAGSQGLNRLQASYRTVTAAEAAAAAATAAATRDLAASAATDECRVCLVDCPVADVIICDSCGAGACTECFSRAYADRNFNPITYLPRCCSCGDTVQIHTIATCLPLRQFFTNSGRAILASHVTAAASLRAETPSPAVAAAARAAATQDYVFNMMVSLTAEIDAARAWIAMVRAAHGRYLYKDGVECKRGVCVLGRWTHWLAAGEAIKCASNDALEDFFTWLWSVILEATGFEIAVYDTPGPVSDSTATAMLPPHGTRLGRALLTFAVIGSLAVRNPDHRLKPTPWPRMTFSDPHTVTLPPADAEPENVTMTVQDATTFYSNLAQAVKVAGQFIGALPVELFHPECNPAAFGAKPPAAVLGLATALAVRETERNLYSDTTYVNGMSSLAIRLFGMHAFDDDDRAPDRSYQSIITALVAGELATRRAAAGEIPMQMSNTRCTGAAAGCRGVMHPLALGDAPTGQFFKCNVCEKIACSSCNAIVESTSAATHTCDDDAKLSVSLISTTTRPCPRCGVAIERSEGCTDMFCSRCKQPFSWNAGRLMESNTNPDYHAWIDEIRSGGSSAAHSLGALTAERLETVFSPSVIQPDGRTSRERAIQLHHLLVAEHLHVLAAAVQAASEIEHIHIFPIVQNDIPSARSYEAVSVSRATHQTSAAAWLKATTALDITGIMAKLLVFCLDTFVHAVYSVAGDACETLTLNRAEARIPQQIALDSETIGLHYPANPQSLEQAALIEDSAMDELSRRAKKLNDSVTGLLLAYRNPRCLSPVPTPTSLSGALPPHGRGSIAYQFIPDTRSLAFASRKSLQTTFFAPSGPRERQPEAIDMEM